MIDRRNFIIGATAFAATAMLPLPLLAAAKPSDGKMEGPEDASLDPSLWGTLDLGAGQGDDALPADNAPRLSAKAQADQAYIPGILPIRVPYTGEAYTLKFREGDRYDPSAFDWINWLLRCHGDHDATAMIDYRLVEQLNYISHRFGGRTITIHSGYRTPRYNKKLAERNRKVAPNSYHMAGRAVDFSIEGVRLRDICSVALYCRNVQGTGGLGYYPGDGFLHIDTGPMRQWVS